MNEHTPPAPDAHETLQREVERLRAENKMLREQHRIQRALMDSVEASDELIGLSDGEGKLFYLNPTGHELLGAGEAATRDAIHIQHLSPAWAIEGAENRAVLHGLDGLEQPVCQTIHTYRSDETTHTLVTARPLNTHCAIVQHLRESEERFRVLVEELHVGVLLQGPNAEILMSNPKALELLGLTEDQLNGVTSFDPRWNVVHEDGADFPGPTHPVPVAISTGQPVHNVVMGVYRPVQEDRVWLLVNADPQLDAQGSVTQVICTFNDITERKKLEEALRKSQRMESIGSLASGIAHDFNNLLTIIMTSADWAGMVLPEESEAREEIEHILDAARRAARMTGQLLTFARRRANTPQLIRMDAAVQELEALLRRALGEHVELVISLQAKDWQLTIDPGQLEQLIINLSTNARDAMPRGGTLTIETTQLRADAPGGDGEERVVLHITDTGEGMTDAVQARIFEPFFTTKAAGHGTGLGLATVHGIVQQAGGTIAVDSRPGEGTRFTLTFPRSRHAQHTHRTTPPQATTRTHARILVVEDEPMVRWQTVRLLEEAGHAVDEANHGRDALEQLTTRPDAFDLIITDMRMPDMDGVALVEALQRPELPVLFVSGHTSLEEERLHALARRTDFLAKPYTAAELIQRVQDLLCPSS